MDKKSGRKLPAGNSYLKDVSELFPQSFYGVIADINTTLDDILSPGYFGNHAQRFKVGGEWGFPKIQLDWEDGSRSLELTVLGTSLQTSKVVVRHDHNFAEAAAALSESENSGAAEGEDFKVEYKGPGKKHCIIRAKDKAIVKEGFATKADALAELGTYVKTLAA